MWWRYSKDKDADIQTLQMKTVELTCPPEHVFSHGVPGEPPLWTLREVDRKLPGSGKVELSIPGDCVQVLTLAL